MGIYPYFLKKEILIMLKLKLLLISLLCCNIALAAETQSNTSDNDRTPPKPVENKVYDAMVGTWQGDSDMMGKKMHEVMKAHWALNHQYLIVEVKATGITDPKMKYEGMGLFGVDSHGKAKTFWFDNWGADAASTGTGEFTDNGLQMEDSNPMFKETRTFEVKGNHLIMHAKGTATWGGKEQQFDVSTVYKKK